MEWLGFTPLSDCIKLEWSGPEGVHCVNCYSEADLDAAPDDVRDAARLALIEVLANKPEPEPEPEIPQPTPEEEIAAAIAALSPEAKDLLRGLL